MLGPLAAGESVLAFAHAEPGGRWSPAAADVKASGGGDEWTIDGVKEPVLHGARADRLVVSAALPDGGTGLFLVEADASGMTRDGYPTFDGGRAARVAFEGTPAVPLGEAGADQTAAIANALDGARVAAANEAVGAMEFALDATSEYLKSRKQFGVPLKTFQALTFRAADMYVSLELARSVTAWATMVLDAGSDEMADAAARAGLQVSRSGRHIGQEAIQLHGGIAMTAEYSVGNYTSHLTALDHLLGDGNFHLATLAASVADHDEFDPLQGSRPLPVDDDHVVHPVAATLASWRPPPRRGTGGGLSRSAVLGGCHTVGVARRLTLQRRAQAARPHDRPEHSRRDRLAAPDDPDVLLGAGHRGVEQLAGQQRRLDGGSTSVTRVVLAALARCTDIACTVCTSDSRLGASRSIRPSRRNAARGCPSASTTTPVSPLNSRSW